jgi:hypothetical protein
MKLRLQESRSSALWRRRRPRWESERKRSEMSGRKSRERRGDDAVRGWKVGAVVGGCLYGFGTLGSRGWKGWEK